MFYAYNVQQYTVRFVIHHSNHLCIALEARKKSVDPKANIRVVRPALAAAAPPLLPGLVDPRSMKLCPPLPLDVARTAGSIVAVFNV
jgi:hypothetical protein